MKGKSSKSGAMKHTAYAGGDSNVASESMGVTDGFKRGGKIKKHAHHESAERAEHAAHHGHRKHGMKSEGVMSHAHAGRKPRKSGGGVMSSASAGTPRGKASHY